MIIEINNFKHTSNKVLVVRNMADSGNTVAASTKTGKFI